MIPDKSHRSQSLLALPPNSTNNSINATQTTQQQVTVSINQENITAESNNSKNENDNDPELSSDGDSNNSSKESRFNPDKHCRYCFSYMNMNDNCSACLCSGLLCHTCLQKELTMSWQRSLQQNHNINPNNIDFEDIKLNCTACRYQYFVSRTKLDIERSSISFFKYFISKTFPSRNDRDHSIFDHWYRDSINSSNYTLPIKTAKMLILIILSWIGFTLLIEMFAGNRITDGRIIVWLFDTYLAIEIMRITSFIDFPERIWLTIIYASRSIIYTVWGVTAYIQEQQFLNLENFEKSHFNWKWLIFQDIITWILLAFEIPKYLKDLQKRALRDEKDKIRVCITSTDGKRYKFILPKPSENENIRNNRLNNVQFLII